MRKTISDELSVQYLLSAPLLEEEVREIESLYFGDDEFLEQLQALELELNLRYLKNDLNPQERYLFENRFLLSPERRNALEILRKLVPEAEAGTLTIAASPVQGNSAETAPPVSADLPSSRWKSLLLNSFPSGWTFQTRAFAAAAVAGVVIIGILSVWALSTRSRGESESASIRVTDSKSSEPADVSQSRNQLPPSENASPGASSSTPSPENPPVQLVAVDSAGARSARQLFDQIRQKELDAFSGTRDFTANPATPAVAPAGPVGIRCRIFKSEFGGGEVEVDADQVFTSRDTIRLQVDVNSTGYLYIVAQGSSGKWSVLFPSDSINMGDNHVRPSDRYQVPASSEGYFIFSGPAGTERLHIIFSRQPSSELDGLVYQPAGGRKTEDTPRSVTDKLDESLISRIYQRIRPRDTVIEKVDEQRAGVQEKAIYAVSGINSLDSRVVLDLNLKHR